MGKKMFVLLIILKMLLQNFMCKDLNLIGHVLPGMLILGIQKGWEYGHFVGIVGII